MSSKLSDSENGGACDAFIEALDGYISGLISLERLRLITGTLLDGDFSEAEDMQAALDSALREDYLDRPSHRVMSTLIELITSEDVATETPRQSGDLLNITNPRRTGIEPGPTDDEPDNELVPGMRLRDRFTLLEQIDSGSMGKIFKAIDSRREESGSETPWVAIKSITEALSNPPDAPVALQKEAANAQRLSHPNIIRVFDFDRDGEHVFMTMELLDGVSLAELLDQHRFDTFPGERARSIIEDVCRGLIYAHDLGIIHADVKPGNVFVTTDNNSKLLDFGISVTANDAADDSGVYAHTPSYASCEVLEGAAPTAQDDVYSLACVAYRILAGRRAFDGATAQAAESEQLTLKPVDDLSDNEWAALRHATAFRRADRTPDVLSFLNEFLSKPAIDSPADTVEPDAPIPAELSVPWLRITGLLVAAATIAAIAVALWPQSKTSDAQSVPANTPAVLADMMDPADVGPPIEYRVAAEENSEKPVTLEPPKRVEPVTVAKAPPRPIVKPDPMRELAKQVDASLDKGFLLAPADGSAKFYIAKMLSIDPEADAAIEARERFADLMMLEVMVAIADEDFDTADELLAETKSIGVGVETTMRYEDALTKAREAKLNRETDVLTAIFASTTPAAVSTGTEFGGIPGSELLPVPDWSMEAIEDATGQPSPFAQDIAASDETADTADRSVIDQEPEILPLSALEFKRQVEPKFPRKALDRNISGWVDLRFRVNTKGRTDSIEIMDAEPKGSFEEAATRAISKWRFKPIMVDGAPAEKFSVVRMRFNAK